MHHCIRLLHYLCKLCRVGDVAGNQFEAIGQKFMAGRKVVINDHFVAVAAQSARRVAADVSRTANNQNPQEPSPVRLGQLEGRFSLANRFRACSRSLEIGHCPRGVARLLLCGERATVRD